MQRYQSLTAKDKKALKSARTFEDLLEVAMRAIQKMYDRNGDLAVVCGPISTGGLGSIAKNLKVFRSWIKRLRQFRIPVFSQMPFEDAILRVKCLPGNSDAELLDRFYLPIFKSGMITDFYFIPGWQTSFGAQWEHKQATGLGHRILYLEDA